MNSGSIAKRYAQALLDEAHAQDVDRQVYDLLGVLYSNWLAKPELREAIINPRIDKERKYTLLVLASGLTPETQTLYTRFMRMLVNNNREQKLRLIIFVFRHLFRELHDIDRVVVETAVPVDGGTMERLISRIKNRTGREVECEQRVNKNLIGGFRLRIGDHRYDYSYKHKLEQIRERLCQTK